MFRAMAHSPTQAAQNLGIRLLIIALAPYMRAISREDSLDPIQQLVFPDGSF
jgi:hypothetical protein